MKLNSKQEYRLRNKDSMFRHIIIEECLLKNNRGNTLDIAVSRNTRKDLDNHRQIKYVFFLEKLSTLRETLRFSNN